MLEYYKNLGYEAIVSAVLALILIVLLLIFFIKRKNLHTFFIIFVYGIIVYIVRVFNIVYDNKLGVAEALLNLTSIFITVSIAVAYQSEIKMFVARLTQVFNKNAFLKNKVTTQEELNHANQEIVKATQMLAKNDIGALIIIVPNSFPKHILDTGTKLNAEVSEGLLESIFVTKGPLHDGAVIISGTTVVAAGCFLPLTQKNNVSKELGTRHRAAIGISEESDVLAIVVSEETGIISTCENGIIKRYCTPDKLMSYINNIYSKKQ